MNMVQNKSRILDSTEGVKKHIKDLKSTTCSSKFCL